uniref:Uncharacterized protein n=1 Tax=Compsopogon caeruleus TaxID=31354 RepID=A0A7S1TES7_9RHOD
MHMHSHRASIESISRDTYRPTRRLQILHLCPTKSPQKDFDAVRHRRTSPTISSCQHRSDSSYSFFYQNSDSHGTGPARLTPPCDEYSRDEDNAGKVFLHVSIWTQ